MSAPSCCGVSASPASCCWRSGCGSGASGRGFPTPTTPTRTRTSCRARSGCSATTWTRTTTSTRRPTRTCCTSSSPSATAGGGRWGHAFATDPTTVSTVARVVEAVLGTVAVGLLYLAGKRLFGRARRAARGGAAGRRVPARLLLHLALNDVPTLAPLCAGAVGRGGRPAVRAAGSTTCIAGIGLGLAAATKYTGGIVLLALLAAFGAHARRNRGAALRGPLLAGVMALAAFLVAVPYAIIDHRCLPRRAGHQSDASREAAGQARLRAGQRLAVLPVVVRLGAGLGASRRRGRGAPAAGVPAALGAARVPRPDADPVRRSSWARRSASSGAGSAGAPVRLPARRVSAR